MRTVSKARIAVLASVIAVLCCGCGSIKQSIPASGPSTAQVLQKASGAEQIKVVEVTQAVASAIAERRKTTLFSETWGNNKATDVKIGVGDIVEVSIWEAPPALLFGSSGTSDPRTGGQSARTTLPEQMINADGMISVPFAGDIRAAGNTPRELEYQIVQRLVYKANHPQAMVRITRNNTANATIVGEVTTATRMPLTARGERLLDALAAAGGVKQPVGKLSLQVTRGPDVRTMPLDAIIRDPRQNIVLAPGDVITSLFQSQSFMVLGATGKNEEVNFEAQGISLAQALARAGGLQDMRADASGVFLFRFEHDGDSTKPVIYQVNLKDPASFFLSQSFPVQDRDILYVSNAPAADLQKFLNIVMSIANPIANINAVVR